MFGVVRPQLSALDMPTLAFVAVCIAALLGILLLVAWVQQRNVRALAWWGSAYLIGASSIALHGRAGASVPNAAGIAASADLPRLRHGVERRAPVPRAAAVTGRGLCRRLRVADSVPIADAAGRQPCAHRARRRGGRDLHLLHRLRIAPRAAQDALFAHRRRCGAGRARGDVPDAACHAIHPAGALCRRMDLDFHARDDALRRGHRVPGAADGQGQRRQRVPQRRLHRPSDRSAQPPRLPGRRARLVHASRRSRRAGHDVHARSRSFQNRSTTVSVMPSATRRCAPSQRWRAPTCAKTTLSAGSAARSLR